MYIQFRLVWNSCPSVSHGLGYLFKQNLSMLLGLAWNSYPSCLHRTSTSSSLSFLGFAIRHAMSQSPCLLFTR